jgi:broad specificity phosphatase PhoE
VHGRVRPRVTVPPVVKLYVVRHADAGHRARSDEPDELRPLSERGWRQAHGLAELLADAGITRLLTSPAQRCVETLIPLAEKLSLVVEPDERLAEGQSVLAPLSLADELRDEPAVVCSHGDVIPDLLEALVRRGLKLKDPARWQKGSTWVLTRDGDGFSKGRYLPPPA